MSGISDKAVVTLQVNGSQAKQMMADLQKNIKATEQAIIRLKNSNADPKDIEKQRKLLRTYQKQLDEMRSATEGVNKAFKSLDTATPRQLEKTLKTLNKQLKDLKPGTAAWDEHTKKIQQVTAQLKVLKQQIQGQESLWQRFSKWWFQCGQAVAALVMGYQQLIDTLRGYVNDYASMEEQMANTLKFTGLSKQGVDELNEAFKALDTRTPREKLNELAQEAGRLGKNTKESVQGYVEAADIINVALVDLGQGATQEIAKLTNIFDVEEAYGTRDAMLKVGSTVNVLSQNCTASKPYIVEFTKRLAGVGSQAKMTIPEIMAFAATLDANGQAVEMSASALSRTIMLLFQKPKEIAKTVGLDVEEFTNTLKRSTTEGLMMFFETLQKMGKTDALAALSPLFKDLGMDGVRMSTILATVANKLDMVKWEMDEANKAFEEGTSATREYVIFNNTAQASIDKAKKRIQELTVELGEKLYPLMAHITSTGSAGLKLLNVTIDFIIKYKREIVTLIAVIGTYNAIMLVYYKHSVMAARATALFQGALKLTKGVIPALRLLITPLINAIQYFTNGLEVNYSMQQRWRKSMEAMKFSSWVGLILAVAGAVYALTARFNDARKAAEQARKEAEEYKKKLTDLDEASAGYCAKEIDRLDSLYKAARDESKSKDERREAAERLQNLYPEYFKNLSIEEIMVGKAKTAYDQLRDSIIEVARARAAAAKIEDNEKELLTLEQQAPSLKEQMDRDKAVYDAAVVDWERAREQEANQSYSNSTDAAVGNMVDVAPYARRVASAGKTYQASQSAYNENQTKQRQLNEANAFLRDKYNISAEALMEPETPELDNFPYGDGDKDKVPLSTDKFAKEKEWREQQEASARISYATGESDYLEHTRRMNEIAVEFYERQLQHTDLSETERLKITADWREAQKKQVEQETVETLEAENNRYNTQIAQLKQFYIDGEISKETYDQKAEEYEIVHQNNLVKISAEGSKERFQAEQQLQNLLIDQTKRKQKEREELEAKYAAMKKDYFGDNPKEAQKKYDDDFALLKIVYDRELVAAGENATEKLRIEEAFERAKLALKKKYGLLAEEDTRSAMERGIADSVQWLNSEGGKAITGSLDTLVSGMSAVFSQLSSLMKAELEIQTALITKRYDAEIEAVQGNTYKAAKLEKKKEAEIAKVKNEANRKMFAMQVLQAIAQTAQNALAAYGSAAQVPIVGYLLAPIAAAMAVAAGGIQIAAIKKQQQASEATGYAEGGFTKPGSKYEPAGIVHAGEWVASQKLLANPGARALIEQLDYVQRTNTIGSLKSEDVSMAITAPQSLARIMEGDASSALMVAAVAQSAEAVKELSERLKEPIAAITTVTGPYGINKAQEEYAALLRNITPKAKNK